MSQSSVNPEQRPLTHSFNAFRSVPILDVPTTPPAAEIPRRLTIWPAVAIGFGGLATLAWNGFLIWHTVKAVIGWVSGDL